MGKVMVSLRVEEGLLREIDVARGPTARGVWILEACEVALFADRVAGVVVGSQEPSREVPKAKPVPRTAAAGFKGSELPGNADVPELGWYRPGSVEAKRGVEMDFDLLRQAAKR